MLQSKVRGCASQVSTSQGGTAAAARQLLQRARSRCQAVGKQQAEPVQEAAQRLPAQRLLPSLASLAASLALLVQPANAGELSMAFPASANPEIREAQKTLVEAWAYVDTLYVGPQDHGEWAKALQEALGASFKTSSAGEVTQITRDLLAKLHDPYTRLLQAEEDAALAAEEEGKIVATGLGLQQLSASVDSSSSTGEQLLVVSFVVQDSPAAQAGVQEGDVVLSIGGQPVGGKDLRAVYKLLAQEANVTLARQPPLPGASTSSSSGSSSGSGSSGSGEEYSVHLKPMPLDFEPAQYGIIDLSKQQDSDAATASSSSTPSSSTIAAITASNTDGSSPSSRGSRAGRVGYLKVLTFSATAPQAVAEALVDIQKEAQQPGGLAGLIVDLRDNPGGIVEAGVDIAQDFLSAGQVLCIAVDKTGQEEQVVLPEAHTLTNLPLAVLVNHSTASTSELLAGTLRDELRAPLIGSTTFGKGRTQRVIRLADGKSTLLVSTLKYFTPQHSTIDQQGLEPDVVCKPEEVLGQQWVGGRVGQEGGSLLDDPCIKLAAQRLADSAA